MAQGYNFGIPPLSTFDDIFRFLIDQFRIQFDDLNYLRWFLVFILFPKLCHVGCIIPFLGFYPLFWPVNVWRMGSALDEGQMKIASSLPAYRNTRWQPNRNNALDQWILHHAYQSKRERASLPGKVQDYSH